MNKEFCTYEQALALKELGFDEPCFGCYDEKGVFGLTVMSIKQYYTNSKEDTWNCSAPLYQQAFRWFREKYNIHAEITWSPSYEYDSGKWSDAIYEITFVDVSYTKEWKAEAPDMQRVNGKQLTYEEAEQACLEKLIEIVKK
jgi:hypothetical protein